MPSAERTFTVTPAPETVVAYLKDFTNAEEWDPGTTKCIRDGSGPIEVGASWRNESELAGNTTELTYTLTELSADRIVFVGENETVHMTDTIDITPAGDGSQVRYHADMELQGAAKLATPVAKLGLEKLGNDTEKMLTDALNALAT